MHRLRSSLLTLVALLLAGTSAADAATLLTAPLQVTANGIACVATNAGTKPLTITSEMFDQNGTALAITSTTCVDVAPNGGCSGAVPAAAVGLKLHCRFIVSGSRSSVRAGLSSSTGIIDAR
jgi:hypothetical protein